MQKTSSGAPSSNNNDTTTNNTPPPVNHVNVFTVTDGTAKSYSPVIASNGPGMMSGYVLNITAGSYPNMIEIEVLSQTAIAVGTYTNTINSANAYFFYGIYGTSNTQGGNQDTITITSINGTNVKGTFSGDLFSNTLQKSLTNGSFDVNF